MRPDPAFLEDIVAAAEEIARFIAGKSFDDLVSDKMLQRALAHNVLVIGEAVSRISAELKARYPKVRWHMAKSMRNMIAHEYFHLNWKVLWETAEEDVPGLRTEVAEII